ncbi:hypothetical protein I7I53_03865 [Histoplasma capsulatum var. duboisii H88]|uniref:Uncharacterized protein n=1 Tax=Ajellomyces capsulatus (strain H88) TaxID=544711 RepID=A0A8A1LNJ9_AJEC8|nr:hypothetical protein I7I53_03865 [Histoplasma capsulatum var. duboisii H88]
MYAVCVSELRCLSQAGSFPAKIQTHVQLYGHPRPSLWEIWGFSILARMAGKADDGVFCSSRDQSVALLCYLMYMYCPRMCCFYLFTKLFFFSLSSLAMPLHGWLLIGILRSPLAAEVGFEENMSQW